MLLDYVRYSVLSQCDLFSGASQESIINLTNKTRIEHFNKNCFLTNQGESSNEIGIIADGEIEICYKSQQGYILPIAIIGELDWFGETVLSRNNIRLVSLKCLGNVTVVFVPKAALLESMSQDVIIMQNVIACLSDRISSVGRYALMHIDNNTLGKIGRQLLNQVEMFSTYYSSRDVIELKLTKCQIAALIGHTRQAIIPYLNKYSELNLLSFGYGIVTINSIENLKGYVNSMC
ncbi:MAG: Crp/Fnr family transcriptional regulator [Vibrio hibernica]